MSWTRNLDVKPNSNPKLQTRNSATQRNIVRGNADVIIYPSSIFYLRSNFIIKSSSIFRTSNYLSRTFSNLLVGSFAFYICVNFWVRIRLLRIASVLLWYDIGGIMNVFFCSTLFSNRCTELMTYTQDLMASSSA